MMVFDSNKMSWAHMWYDIPFIWNDLNTMGEGITVAVIDTGIDTLHDDFQSNIHPSSKSFIDDSLMDLDQHGTNMAGIIGATGKKIYGVAPNVKLVILRATKLARGVDVKKYAEALNFASTIDGIDIISFSNIFIKDDIDLQNAVKKCLSSKKVLIAAIGNNRNFMKFPDGPDRDTFPSCYDNVISVGAFDKDGKISAFSNWNPHLCLLAPGESMLTTKINNSISTEKGTSISTAFTAGCLALMLSYAKRKSIKPEKCIDALLSSCDDIGLSVGRDIQSGFGRFNFRNAVSKIK